jgi:hypothetical protein
MSTEESDPSNSVVSMLMNTSRGMANWYVGLGMLGIFLALLNIFGYIHPNYHLSWGGLLTFEITNAAFEPKSTSTQFVLSDVVFIGLCVAISALGFRTIGKDETGLNGWFKGLFINDTWPALVDPENGGWNKLFGAWSLLLGIVFYFFYGIVYSGWIDIGVYSVSIALIAFGLALLMAAKAPEGNDNLD